jgi:hypothetical protein
MALRDWNPFARSDEPAASAELSSALAALDRLMVERAELAAAGGSLGRILHAAFLGPVAEASHPVDPDLLRAAWRASIPAFRAGEAPPVLDARDLRARGLAVLEALRDENPRAVPWLEAIRAGKVDLHAWALSVFADTPDVVEADASELALDPALGRAVLRLALLRPLSQLSARLAQVRSDGDWASGACPHCGSPPTLGESRGLEQRRYWRCGLCAADWPGERLRCPFCGETDHRRLSYLFAEGEPDRYRLCRCETCGGRVKVVASLAPLSAPGLLVAELASAHLEPTDA